jgi:hydrogenase expression/formation protein HypE
MRWQLMDRTDCLTQVPQDLDRALAILRSNNEAATEIGTVMAATTPAVILNSKLGTTRWLNLLSGEQLPRIC